MSGAREVQVLIAIPRGIAHLRIGGIAGPLRVLRQLRRWSGASIAVFVVGDGEREVWTDLAKRHGVLVATVAELSAVAEVERTVFASGDLVLSGEGTEILADPSGPDWLAELPGGEVLGLGSSAGLPEGIRTWCARVVAGDAAAAQAAGRRSLPSQRVCGRLQDATAAALEGRVRDALGRAQDPNFPRITGRRFSKPISTRLARFDLSPNWVTTAAIAVGGLAAWLVYRGGYASMLAGALCLIVSRLLDDCDGEVARLTQRQSAAGEAYDITADVVVHMSIFIALTLQLHRDQPDGGFLGALLSLLLGGGMATALILLFVNGTDLPRRSPLIRRLETAASGDFAYLFLIIALLGIGDWFLYACAVGSHAFWLLLAITIWRYSRDGELGAETLGPGS